MIPAWLVNGFAAVGVTLLIYLLVGTVRTRRGVGGPRLVEPPPEAPPEPFLGIVGDDVGLSFPEGDLLASDLIEAQFEGPSEPVLPPDAQELAWRAANTRELKLTLHHRDVEELERLGREITEHGWGVLGTPMSKRGWPPFMGAPTPEAIVSALVDEAILEHRLARPATYDALCPCGAAVTVFDGHFSHAEPRCKDFTDRDEDSYTHWLIGSTPEPEAP